MAIQQWPIGPSSSLCETVVHNMLKTYIALNLFVHVPLNLLLVRVHLHVHVVRITGAVQSISLFHVLILIEYAHVKHYLYIPCFIFCTIMSNSLWCSCYCALKHIRLCYQFCHLGDIVFIAVVEFIKLCVYLAHRCS